MFGIKINIERKPKEKKEKKEKAGGFFSASENQAEESVFSADENNSADLSATHASQSDAGWVWQAIAKWSLRLLIFLTPLFFLPWGVSLVAANKQFLAVILVSVAFIAWLAKTIASGRLVWARTPLNIAIWILVLAWGISAYFSLSKTKSFGFLSVEPDSLLNMLSYFLAFFLVGSVFGEKEKEAISPEQSASRQSVEGSDSLRLRSSDLRSGSKISGIQNGINIFLCSLAVLAIFTGLKFLNINFLSLLFGGQAWDFAKAIDFNTIGTVNALGLFLGFGFTLIVGLLVAGKKEKKDDAGKLNEEKETIFPEQSASRQSVEGSSSGLQPESFGLRLGSKISGINKFYQAGLALLALVLGAELLLINFRGVWWALAIAMLFIVAFAFTREVQEVKEKKKDIIRTQKLVLPIIILAISVILLLVNLPLGNLISFPAEVSPSNSATYDIAKEVWKNQSGSTAIGSGPATFSYDYGQFRSKIINETAFWGIKFNQGSSFILTSLSTVGIIGFIGLILILAAFIWQALKMFRAKQSEKEQGENGEDVQAPIIATILFALAAWFLYPINFSLMLFAFIFLGLLAASQSMDSAKKREISLLVSPQRTLIISLILIVLMIGSVSSLYLEGQKYVASLYFSSGLNYFNRTGDPDIALEKFVKAINLDGSDSLYWRSASQAFLVKTNVILNSSKWQGAAAAALEDLRSEFQLNMSQAISFAQRATQADPNESLNWTNLGYIYENVLSFVTGGEKFMIDSYSKALALEPNSPALQVDLGRGHINFADRLAAQMNELSKAQKPDNNQINALIAQRNQELDLAIKDLERGVDLKPDYSQAHYLLVQAFSRREDIKKAIVKSIDYFSLNQKDPGAAFQLGFFYYKDNQLDNAKAALEWAIALSQDYSNARYFLGLIYDAQGNKQAAKEQFEKIAALNSENAEVRTILDNLNAGRGALETVVPPAPAPEQRIQAPVQETGGAQQQPLKP